MACAPPGAPTKPIGADPLAFRPKHDKEGFCDGSGTGRPIFSGHPLIPVSTMPLTKYCWAEKKMITTGTTDMRLAAIT